MIKNCFIKGVAMKKLFLAIFLILCTNTLFGQFFDIFDDVGIEILPLRYEFDISEDSQLNHGLNVGLLNYYFENSKTGLGFDTRLIFPKYYYNFQDHVISFFGLNLYWNILKFLTGQKLSNDS